MAAEPSTAAATAPVIFKKRTAKTNVRKRAATPPPASANDNSPASSSDNDDDDDDETAGASAPSLKRRKKAGLALGSSNAASRAANAHDLTFAPTQHTASTSTTIAPSTDATKSTTWYEDASTAESRAPDPRAAKPTHTYANATTSSTSAAPPSRAPVGPVKSTTVRTVTTTDFAPDVCKDYKTTGFCGFGDSCKFLHAREDYAAGWQLDRDWAKRQTSSSSSSSSHKPAELSKDEQALESIPFACPLCKKPYTSPIVTRCGHYFCEACALARYKRTPGCAACGAATDGIFNGARGLRRLLDKKRARVLARKAEARERGEDVSPDEEDGGDGV